MSIAISGLVHSVAAAAFGMRHAACGMRHLACGLFRLCLGYYELLALTVIVIVLIENY